MKSLLKLIFKGDYYPGLGIQRLNHDEYRDFRIRDLFSIQFWIEVYYRLTCKSFFPCMEEKIGFTERRSRKCGRCNCPMKIYRSMC